MRRIATLALIFAVAACKPAAQEPAAKETAPPAPEPTFATQFDTAKWVKETYGTEDTVLFREGRADLDDDGTDEIFVFTGGPALCGSGGCPLNVLRAEPDGATILAQTTVTQLPVGILETSTNGMRDIWVTTAGGGAPEAIRKLAWNGSTYPANPTIAEEIAVPGKIVIDVGELKSADAEPEAD